MRQSDYDYDVIVVGGGNAALCAALAASEQDASVCVLEWAPLEKRGGNSRFTAGAIRFAYSDVEQVRSLLSDLSDEEFAGFDFGRYSEDDFYDDMLRVTNFRTDAELAEILVTRSYSVLQWLKGHGVRFVPNGRQVFRVGDRLKFWGGIIVDTWGGGPGLVEALYQRAEALGVKTHYRTRAVKLLCESGAVLGVRARQGAKEIELRARAVVLACGGYEANSEMRARYLGPGWDVAKVRGTRYNMGDGIAMALEAGAMPWGEWSGCHAVPWDQNAPHFGDLSVGDGFSKLSYPLGIMVNVHGQRFVDEGADFRNYTYARYGREILRQPEGYAYQVFDASVFDLLRDEYSIRQVTVARADTIDELAKKMRELTPGFDADSFVATVKAFNESVDEDTPFNPAVKDGRGTRGISPRKSNWALALKSPPYRAFAVTCGVTFTFGGVKIDDRAQVLSMDEEPVPGLYAAGELVGGLFYGNYPGGSGLLAGSVFGRIAGTSAGLLASER